MELSEYQRLARRTAGYPREQWLAYPALGLAGEAGEVAEHAKKAIRDDGSRVTDERREALAKELGDVLWYVAQLATELELDLDDVAAGNLAEAPLAAAPRRPSRVRRRALVRAGRARGPYAGGAATAKRAKRPASRSGRSARTSTPSGVCRRLTSPPSACSSARLGPSL